jgi:NAD(P)-dependent dehydrogenase (short-subunit alcohol dehydrogenase family)
MMELELQGKIALVTGASRGIGKAIADELAGAGACILLVARDVDALRETADALRQSGARRIEVHQADLTDIKAASDCIAAAIGHFGHLDALVNCAGATKRGDFLKLTDADWADGFALKFHGCVRLCRAAWPHLVSRHGCVINIVGVGSRTPGADFSIGGSVNSALLNFTKALADVGIQAGVRVNAINPGYISTERLSRRIEGLMKERNASRTEIESELLKAIGIQRFGDPKEIGKLAVFLASNQASYIHGATIDIDGGATRGL